jgi:NarL family two-component system sensor histidine kinase LiaS
MNKNIGMRSFRWHLMLFSLLLTLVTVLIILVDIFIHYRLDWRILWSLEWTGLPLLFLLSLGALVGFLYGTKNTGRLEQVMEASFQFERGNFSYRLPPQGNDEVGTIANQLNQMANRLEQQVASLQKLSTERTEWQTQMKQTVVTEERGRLARELHDTISQQLFAISMMSSAILAKAAQEDAGVTKQLGLIEKLAGDAQQEMRALLMHLRPATLEGKGLTEGLKDLLHEVEEKQPIEVQWEMTEITDLPKGIEDHLFRIVQEGLSNVLRHSKASKVHVRLVERGQHLHLKIIDNGIGFEPTEMKISTYGLKSITERASEIGGIGEVISVPGKGTQVYVKVPIIRD